jgi:hypothetical protein
MQLAAVMLAVVAVLTCGIGAAEERAPAAKKLIYFGWGNPETQYVREHWRDMEKMPFDGTGIIVAVDRQAWQQGKRDTGNQLGWQMMGKRP